MTEVKYLLLAGGKLCNRVHSNGIVFFKEKIIRNRYYLTLAIFIIKSGIFLFRLILSIPIYYPVPGHAKNKRSERLDCQHLVSLVPDFYKQFLDYFFRIFFGFIGQGV